MRPKIVALLCKSLFFRVGDPLSFFLTFQRILRVKSNISHANVDFSNKQFWLLYGVEWVYVQYFSLLKKPEGLNLSQTPIFVLCILRSCHIEKPLDMPY